MYAPIDAKPGKTDLAVVFAKGALGALPYIGPLIAEIVGTIIPNQRLDRIAEFLQILDAEVHSLQAEMLHVKMQTEEFIDLFEDAVVQACRSLGSVRKRHIASLLKNSLSRDDLSHIEQKKLLAILGELNDVEIIILTAQSLSATPNAARSFRELHGPVFEPIILTQESSEEEVSRAAVHRTYREHLRQLGLLRPKFRKPKKGELPEFDPETGMMKVQSYHITSLGRLLITYIDSDGNREEQAEVRS